MSAERSRWFRRLLSCWWHLGWRHGLSYWRIMRRADKDPDFLRLWAFRCRVEANDEEFTHGKRFVLPRPKHSRR